MVMQFGYVFIFGWSFPLAAVLAFANNMVELRSDMAKLCTAIQRPVRRSSNGIGIWAFILEFYAIVAVLTNTAFLIMHSWTHHDSFFPQYSIPFKICSIIIAEHCWFFLKALIYILIEDVPGNIRTLRAKERFLLQGMSNQVFLATDKSQ
jgi:anoctamin-8